MEPEKMDAAESWDEISLENAPDEDTLGENGDGEDEKSAETAPDEGGRDDVEAEEAKITLPPRGLEGHRELFMSAMPESVKSAVRRGMTLGEAMRSSELERLRSENMALKQEKENAFRAIGSARTSGRRSAEAFDEAWYDGT